MIRINQIKIPVCPAENKAANITDKINSILKTDKYRLIKLVKESIDARDKSKLMYIYSVDIEAENESVILRNHKNNKDIYQAATKRYIFPHMLTPDQASVIEKKPIIIGAGPAGYFCGLQLARAGYKPIIIERGCPVEQRTKDVEQFWEQGSINPNSNVSFGEGGAGTFSDGKLTTGIKDKFNRIDQVLEDFIKFGANEDISYVNKPHIGTDILKNIMKNMRQEILSLGGIILFQSTMTDIIMEKHQGIRQISGVIVDISANKAAEDILSEYGNSYITFNEEGRKYAKISANSLILAIGHSSRDTFVRLEELSVPMESKAFAIGLRIEHKAMDIDKAQYGDSREASYLPASSYKMTYRSKEQRSVYSFCMCPGGYVVNASTDMNQAVVNGMSYRDRAGENSNSAIVVNVTPQDFEAEGYGKYGVLAGMYYQIHYERKAYNEGCGLIPVQKYGDYKAGKITETLGKIKPNIKGKYHFANLNNCLPPYVNNAIIEGVEYYGTKLEGFACEDAVLSGIESRTSSPVRILRGDDYMSEIKGLFPCGEGAGYAGGITSAAVDGMKIAEACAQYLKDFYNI